MSNSDSLELARNIYKKTFLKDFPVGWPDINDVGGEIIVTLSHEELAQVTEYVKSKTKELPKKVVSKLYAEIAKHVLGSLSGEEQGQVKEFVEDVDFDATVRGSPNYIWKYKDKDGWKVIQIDEMDDRWLVNSIKYVQRQAVDKILLEGKASNKREYFDRHQGYNMLMMEAKYRKLDKEVAEDE